MQRLLVFFFLVSLSVAQQKPQRFQIVDLGMKGDYPLVILLDTEIGKTWSLTRNASRGDTVYVWEPIFLQEITPEFIGRFPPKKPKK